MQAYIFYVMNAAFGITKYLFAYFFAGAVALTCTWYACMKILESTLYRYAIPRYLVKEKLKSNSIRNIPRATGFGSVAKERAFFVNHNLLQISGYTSKVNANLAVLTYPIMISYVKFFRRINEYGNANFF